MGRKLGDRLCSLFWGGQLGHHLAQCGLSRGLRKGKEDGIYIVPLSTHAYSKSTQAWITQFYLQTTPCLPFLRKRSPDGATTTEATDIQLQLTTHLLTPKG